MVELGVLVNTFSADFVAKLFATVFFAGRS